MRALGRRVSAYRAYITLGIQETLAFRALFWASVAGRLLIMVVCLFFWRAVFESGETPAPAADAALRYVLLAQVMAPLTLGNLIPVFGKAVMEGSLATELLRPLDLQESYYAWSLGTLVATQLREMLVLGAAAALIFGVRLPINPATWLSLLVTLWLGHAIIFLFDWAIAMLTFWTTAGWGLCTLRHVVALFFGGALLPRVLMPTWLQQLSAVLPFQQVLQLPATILLGEVPPSRLPHVWLVQLLWVLVLWIGSRLAYRAAIRQVTVAGG